mgnify:CR=1 FL=1
MGSNQETLIYIEDKDKLDASVAANSFAHSAVKNRVYINTLGAKLGMKFLASEDIDVSNIHSMHSIKKILEEVDIADIMLSNIHIDVRVVYDENAIFVPKSHFEYGLTPDIYLVFKLAKDMSCVAFLGYFEPSLINKNNANSDFYFIEKEKLSPAVSLKNFISNYKGSTNSSVPREDIENSERIIMAMADNDVSDEDRRYLIKQLTKSAELRDKFIEYENFETLSYKAMTDAFINKKAISEDNIVDLSVLDGLDNIQKVENSNADNELLSIGGLEDITLDGIFGEEELPENDTKKVDEVDGIQAFEEVKDEAEQETSSEVENTIQPSDNISENIAGTVAGATAGAVAGATIGGAISATAGELLNTMNTAEAAIDTVGDIANAVEGISDVVSAGIDAVKSGVDKDKEVVNDNNTTEENAQMNSISLEDVDISNIEHMELPQENIKEETISLDDVEVADEVNTDFIDAIDNKISLDDVELPSEDVAGQSSASVDVDESDLQTISLDDVDASIMEENISEDSETSLLSLGDEDLEDVSNTVNNQDDLKDETDLAKSSENIIEPLDEEEDTKKAGQEGFGDALIENLTQEEIENITIDDLGINEGDELTNIDDISSSELLSQIDEVLNSSATVDKPVEEVIPSESFDDEVKTDDFDGFDSQAGSQEIEAMSIDDLLDGLGEDETSLESVDDLNENLENTETNEVDELDKTNESESNETNETNETNEVDKKVETDEKVENIANIDDLGDIDNLNDIGSIGDVADVGSVEELGNLTDSTNSTDEQPQIVENNQEESSSEEALNAVDENVNNYYDVDGNGNLEMLFSDTDTESDMDLDDITPEKSQVVPGQALFPNQKKQSNQKTLIVAAALVAVVAAASTIMFLKSKDNSASDVEPINSNQNEIVGNQTPAVPQDSSANGSSEDMLATNTPNINQNTAQVTKTKQQVKELKNTTMNKKPVASGSYLQVNKLVWSVPSNLSNSAKMQNYLRTTGKSLKLALSADLLLANEYAYTNQMKVNLKIGSNGEIQQATIGSSSGSTQIDNIVLQSVKDTMNAVKPPVDEIKGQNFILALIIYF